MATMGSSAVLACAIVLALVASATAGKYPLHEAARNRDLKKVKQLVEVKKINVNARDAAGFTPLHYAADSFTVYWHPFDQRLTNVIKYLLSKGANPRIPFPNYAGLKKYTVLHFFAYDGNLDIVPLLVNAKANVNARDDRGYTPLHSAAKCDFRLSCDDCSKNTRWKAGARPTLAYLIKKGGKVLAKTNDGKTVLDIAVEFAGQNCPLTVKYLRDATAAAKKKAKKG